MARRWRILTIFWRALTSSSGIGLRRIDLELEQAPQRQGGGPGR